MNDINIWNPPKDSWVYMPSGPGELSALKVKEVLAEGKSAFQTFAIADTVPFGRILILDGQLQSAEYDEWIYHEAFVLPPMCAHPAPKRVAVLGGGEGAMLREVLRHPTVESAVMVDIDGEVVEACKAHLPTYHEGAFDDPRVSVVADDARAWLENQPKGQFDIVLIDLTEPLAGGPSCKLFTKEFYQLVQSSLTPSGVVALQAGAVRPGSAWAFGRVIATLKSVFPHVLAYSAWVTSFFEEWGFAVVGGDEVSTLTPKKLDEVLSARNVEPKFLDGTTFRGLTCLSRYIRKDMELAQEVITDAKPLGLHR